MFVARSLVVGARYGVAFASAASLAIALSPMYLVGALAVPMRHDLGLTRTELGLLVSLFMGVALMWAAPAGQFVDRRGIAPTVTAGLAATGLGGVCIGTLGSHPGALFIGVALCGFGLPFVDAATNLAIAHNVLQQHQAMSFGLKELGAPCAALAGGIIVVRLGGQGNWQRVFIGLGVIACLGVVCAIRWAPHLRAQVLASGRHQVHRDVALRWAGVLGLGMGLALGCATAITTYGIDFAGSVGLTTHESGALLATASAGVVAMRLFVAIAITHREQRAVVLLPAMLVLGAVGHFALGLNTQFSTIAGVLLGLIFGFGWAGTMFLVVARMYPARTGRAAGLVMMGTYAGALLGIPAFGWVIDHRGFIAAWQLSGTCALASAVVLALALRRHGRPATMSDGTP